MSELIRVNNTTNCIIGLPKMDGTQVIIQPRSFTRMSKDDIDYACSICDSFAKGHVRVADVAVEKQVIEEQNIDVKENAAFMSEDELKKHLRASADNIRKWLGSIHDMVVIANIYEYAKKLDLPASKMEVIEKAARIQK